MLIFLLLWLFPEMAGEKIKNRFQLMDSNHGPRGYGPRTLPLRQAERWEAASDVTRTFEVPIKNFLMA